MSYVNAREELINFIGECNKIIEDIDYLHIYVKGIEITSIEEINKLSNITYNSGYGTQELYGAVVFKDKSWLERGEYDGSEWWKYKTVPTKEAIENHIEEVKKWK